eukprot:350686-Chlamydomonas_euryale.AAC.2
MSAWRNRGRCRPHMRPHYQLCIPPCSLVENTSAELATQRIDEGGIDGDLCAIVSSAGGGVAAMVWPTAGRLKQLKALAEVRRARSFKRR